MAPKSKYSSRRGIDSCKQDKALETVSNPGELREITADSSGRSEDTLAAATPKCGTNIPAERSDIRLKPAPANSYVANSNRSIFGLSAAIIDAAVNSAIVTKQEIHEERAFSILAKLVNDFIDSEAIECDLPRNFLATYYQREVKGLQAELRYMQQVVGGLLADIDRLAGLIEPGVKPMSRDTVSRAKRRRTERLQYRDLAKDLSHERTPDVSESLIDELRCSISGLHESRNRLFRCCELRKKQVVELIYWVQVLESGTM